jgi:hypothetical protein
MRISGRLLKVRRTGEETTPISQMTVGGFGAPPSCRPYAVIWGHNERTSTLADVENVAYSGHSSPRQSMTPVPDNQPAGRIGRKNFLGANAHFIRNLTCVKSKCAESVGREARGRPAQRLCISGFINEQKVFDEPLTLVRVIARQWLTLESPSAN